MSFAEEEQNEQNEQRPEAEAGDEKPEEAAQGSAAEEAPPQESPGEEPSAEESPAEEAPAGEAPAAEAPGEDQLEGLDWKARRRLERSRRATPAGPQRSSQDRARERAERRRAAARSRTAYRRKRRQRRERGQGTPPAERRSAPRKVRQGRVVSTKADKTITVRIDIVRRHPSYEKIIRQGNNLHAHDERGEANEGDLVRVVETRPLSRTKRWRLAEILERAR